MVFFKRTIESDWRSPRSVEASVYLTINSLEVNGTALIVACGDNKNLQLASRNVSYVELVTGETLNTYQVLKSDKLVFSKSAFEKVEARLTQE